MLIRKIVSPVLLLLISAGCVKFGETKNSFSVQNNASHSLQFYVAAAGIQHKYPDTALEENKVPMVTILPGESASWGTGLSWEEFYAVLPADTLSVYLFHPDTLQQYDWTFIRSQYKVLKRYDLSRQDLERLQYVILFP